MANAQRQLDKRTTRRCRYPISNTTTGILDTATASSYSYMGEVSHQLSGDSHR